MRHLILILFVLLGFAAYSQDDPGLNLAWETFVDSSDFQLVEDTLDLSAPFDSIVVTDTLYVTKYRSYDTINITQEQFGVAYHVVQRIRTYEEQAASLLEEVKIQQNEVAVNRRRAMKDKAEANSAALAYQEFTGAANAYVDIYNELWPKIPSLRITSTITDTSNAYYIGNVTATPNAVGIVRDTNNVIVARIFPRSPLQWNVVIANDGVVGNGISVELSSDDYRRYYMPEVDPNVGRVVIILDQNLQ